MGASRNTPHPGEAIELKVDLPTPLLMLITVALICKMKKLPESAIVALAALAGLVIYLLLKNVAAT